MNPQNSTDNQILEEYRKNGGWVMETARKCRCDHKRVRRIKKAAGLS